MTLKRKRRSKVWKIPASEFAHVVASASTLTEILKYCGLQHIGGNFKTVLSRISEENLDVSHIPRGASCNKGRKFPSQPISLELVLIEHSTYGRQHLKKRLLQTGLLENICAECKMGSTWQGKPLVLRLDHRNGVNDDARLTNLRLLCPNCDSQTPTFSGRNLRGVNVWRCQDCSKAIGKGHQRCRACENKYRTIVHPQKYRKVEWPTYAELKARISNSSQLQVAKELGISNTAVRKMLVRMGAGSIKFL